MWWSQSLRRFGISETLCGPNFWQIVILFGFENDSENLVSLTQLMRRERENERERERERTREREREREREKS